MIDPLGCPSLPLPYPVAFGCGELTISPQVCALTLFAVGGHREEETA
jgi:hypothetical protein